MKTVIDIETTVVFTDKKVDPSPYHHGNKIVMFQYHIIDTGEKGCIVLNHKEKITREYNGYKIQEILDKTTVAIGHNLKFDFSWLYECGYKYTGKFYDTMIVEYVFAKGLKLPLSLGESCERYGLSAKLDILKDYLEQNINVDEIPLALLTEYGMADIQSTLELYLHQKYLFGLELNNSMMPAIELMFDLLPVCIEMERNGCYIDTEALSIVEAEYIEEKIRLENVLNQMVAEVMGDTPVNLSSPDDLCKIVYSRQVDCKDTWKRIFNLGSNTRNSVKKRKYPKRYTWNQFYHIVLKNMTTVKRTVANQCNTCQGLGKVHKITKKGVMYKKPNICKTCEGCGYTYTPTDKIAGFKVKPLGSHIVTASGFATDKKTIEKLVEAGKLSDNARLFLETLVRLNAVDTYLSTFIEGIKRNTRPDNLLHTSLNQTLTSTGRLSSSRPNCFSDDTEVLTDSGWKLFKDVGTINSIAQLDLETAQISFAKPLDTIAYWHEGTMQHITKTRFMRQAAIDMLVTEDHNCYTFNRKNGNLKLNAAIDYPKDAIQLQAGIFPGGDTHYTSSKIILLCAFQADGHTRKADGIVEFTFKKQRKIDRLTYALALERIPHRVRNKHDGSTVISISRLNVPEYFTKVFNHRHILSFDKETLNAFREEVLFWDGCGKSQYCSSIKSNADIVQIVNCLTGYTAKVRVYKDKYYIVDITTKMGNLTSNTRNTSVQYSGMVYCVTMPKGTVVTRRNGVIAITGNCQNMPRSKTFPVRKAFISRWKEGKILEVDWAALEYRVAVLLSHDKAGIESILQGKDRHKITMDILVAAGQPVDRQGAKAHTFKPLYGGSSGTEAEQEYYKAFSKEHVELTQYQRELCSDAVQKGYIQSPSGRIYAFPGTRRIAVDRVTNQTQIYNYCIQGFATADIMPCALVILYDKFKKANIRSKLILTVHDSVEIDCHPEEVDICVKLVYDSFKETENELLKRFNFKCCVPLAFEMEIGDNWMEKEKIHYERMVD